MNFYVSKLGLCNIRDIRFSPSYLYNCGNYLIQHGSFSKSFYPFGIFRRNNLEVGMSVFKKFLSNAIIFDSGYDQMKKNTVIRNRQCFLNPLDFLVKHCAFYSCKTILAFYPLTCGGAIYARSSDSLILLHIIQSGFENCSACLYGGAVFFTGSELILDSIHAINSNASCGAVVYAQCLTSTDINFTLVDGSECESMGSIVLCDGNQSVFASNFTKPNQCLSNISGHIFFSKFHSMEMTFIRLNEFDHYNGVVLAGFSNKAEIKSCIWRNSNSSPTYSVLYVMNSTGSIHIEDSQFINCSVPLFYVPTNYPIFFRNFIIINFRLIISRDNKCATKCIWRAIFCFLF